MSTHVKVNSVILQRGFLQKIQKVEQAWKKMSESQKQTIVCFYRYKYSYIQTITPHTHYLQQVSWAWLHEPDLPVLAGCGEEASVRVERHGEDDVRVVSDCSHGVLYDRLRPVQVPDHHLQSHTHKHTHTLTHTILASTNSDSDR